MTAVDVIVRGSGTGFVQEILAGRHRLRADEPAAAGGTDSGPNPYGFLQVALGSCMSMTVALYARRKDWPLEGVTVCLRHAQIHASDCAECETKEACSTASSVTSASPGRYPKNSVRGCVRSRRSAQSIGR